jgi:D-serine deaminase-like pyridoxal phosphate-dependent protein
MFMRIEDLDTPTVVIDLDCVEHNIEKLQRYCDAYSIRSRPHIKTHKLPALAYKQLQAGAVGITSGYRLCRSVYATSARYSGGTRRNSQSL